MYNNKSMNTKLNQIKTFEYTDILGWSVSRYDKYQLCKRQYYYDYYAKYDREFPRAKITALKQMTSFALETGNIVHDIIKVLLERLLKSEQPVNEVRFLDYAARKTEEYVTAKKFAEVYYGEIEKVRHEDVFENVKISLNNFLQSTRFLWITQKAVDNKTSWVIEPPGFGETRINGMKAYCKVDFLFPVENNIFILDWKTGKQDEKKHKKQLIGYSTWASYHFDSRPENIFPLIAYLQPQYSEMKIVLNEYDIQEFIGCVESETKEMYSYCASVEKNIPKDKQEFVKTQKSFACKFCNYRELCK